MTLLQVVKELETVAAAQPAIKMVVENDIFRLNTYADAQYGAFAWTQGQHSASTDGNLIHYAFTMFYVDRLRADKENQVEVQSVGIGVINNVLRTLEERGIYCESSYTFQAFNQRFLDECAGVYCTVTLSVPASTCFEDFGGETWYLKDEDGKYFIDYNGRKIILVH